MKHIKLFEQFVNEEASFPAQFGINEPTNEANKSENLKPYLDKKYPGFKMYPAETGEINVGFLRKDNDYTWNNVMTYYWNTNDDLDDCSVTKVKL